MGRLYRFLAYSPRGSRETAMWFFNVVPILATCALILGLLFIAVLPVPFAEEIATLYWLIYGWCAEMLAWAVVYILISVWSRRPDEGQQPVSPPPPPPAPQPAGIPVPPRAPSPLVAHAIPE